MEKVEGLLRSLKLSETERKGLRLGGEKGESSGGELKAFRKVMSEKPANAEGVKRFLSPIWCPLEGMRCKEVKDNVFLVTFFQESGKRKALDEGLWNFNNDLLVMADFDPTKALDESGGSGSDSRSWRVDGTSGVGSKSQEKGDEATSPLKKQVPSLERGTQRQLAFGEDEEQQKGKGWASELEKEENENNLDKMELGGEVAAMVTRSKNMGPDSGQINEKVLPATEVVEKKEDKIKKKFKRRDKQERAKKGQKQ
ncbi:hypothetical protein ACQ4PT_001559 [Festuca glaucescens]